MNGSQLYDTVKDIAAAHTALCAAGRAPEAARTTREFWRSLDATDARRLAEAAVARDAVDDYVIEMVARSFPDAFTDLHVELIERDILLPYFLYSSADAEAAKVLTNRILKADSEDVPRMLRALAWTRNDDTVAQFSAWSRSMPSNFAPYVRSVIAYAMEAGWTITQDGAKRELYHAPSYTVFESRDLFDEPAVELAFGTPRIDKCRWCDNSLFDAFALDFTDVLLSNVDPRSRHIVVPSCSNCMSWNTMLWDVDIEGNVQWSGDNSPGAEYSDSWTPPELKFWRELPSRSPFESFSESRIGGVPYWLNDASYPDCPRCSMPMPFVAQLDYWGIGFHYAFLCGGCDKIATTWHQ